MGNIISFFPARETHFAVYQHRMINDKGILSDYRAIVIKDQSGLIQCFTALETYSREYTGQNPKIQVRQKQELEYICRALNDIYAHNRITHLSDITADMIFEFFDVYCAGADLTSRSMHNCVKHVSHFFGNLAAEFNMKFSPEDILHVEYYRRDKASRKEYRCYIPRYIPPDGKSNPEIPRDIPLRIAQQLIDLAYAHDPMIAFALVAQVSAGLRPAEAMNMRQHDSPVSLRRSVQISYAGNSITAIQIDLKEEYVLRADGVSVGRIKKKRVVNVYKKFLSEFATAYNEHLKILENHPVDTNYKPMFLTRDGQAMTYGAYRYRLHRLINQYLIPMLERSANPEDVILAMHLKMRCVSPHIFRHVFSVRLVLDGLDVAQVMTYRGDDSPESAITYLANKGELVKRLIETHESVISSLAKGGVVLYDAATDYDCR